jgi:hypothetical protein
MLLLLSILLFLLFILKQTKILNSHFHSITNCAEINIFAYLF